MTGTQHAATISVVVLTLNEASIIGGCLKSVRWADDVIVVDSGSCDDTLSVAASLGVRTYLNVPAGPFSIADQRNWALEHCHISTTWVLFLDADERVTEELQNELRAVLSQDEAYDAYEMTPRYWYLGAWMRRTMHYPNWHPRLVRFGAARFAGGVWEHFEAGPRIGRIGTPYEHYGNSKGLSEWLARHDRYSDWDAKTIIEYLDHRDSSSFGTARKLAQRRMAARLWPVRPAARFILMYFVRAGFLDGWQALLFCARYSIYEYMILEKIVEQRRKRMGLPL
jgi:glycosyltransferase involved in cell wall biosynthesis